ncbi:MAG: chlorite dismutase family protein [Actinobacteria bacterium]|nr:chlorite dismutase family protein [Actinomycetota bacterium]
MHQEGSILPTITTFTGGRAGPWRIVRNEVVVGAPLEPADRLDVVEGDVPEASRGMAWRLRGIPSYERYVNRTEHADLEAATPPLGRMEATAAALIPINKSSEWWGLPQDLRREIFEEGSHHISTGLRYLPAVARRLYHGHDLGEDFDFLTWFEFSPDDAAGFEELVSILRTTREWTYVVREVDIRLARELR